MNALTKQEGRTIVFVSHNLLALQNLCTRGIWLDTGTLQYDGNSPETIAAYMSFVSKNSQEKLPTRNDRKGNGKIKIVQIELKDLENKQIHSVTSGQTFDIVFKYVTSEYPSLLTGITFGITLNLINGTCLTLHHNKLIGSKIEVSGTEGIFRARIHELPLNENLYSVTYSIMDGMDYIDSLDNAFEIKVIAGKIYNYLKLPPNSFGSLLLNCEWFNN